MIRYLSLFLFITLLAAYGVFAAEKAVDMDLIRLTTGQVVEGCLTQETETEVILETYGGTFFVPMTKVESLTKSRPGESALLLGKQLAKHAHFSRAETFLKRAQGFLAWREEAKAELTTLAKAKAQSEKDSAQTEQSRIESIIRHKGLQAGIEALQKQQKDSYWGSYRGRLHLLMARERLDHLDLSMAERHLALAEQYGVEPKQWIAVRDEILEFKKRSTRIGKEQLAKLYPPKPTPNVNDSNFLALISSAQQNGEKTPPLEWLRYVDFHARLNELDPLLVWAIIDTESSWQPRAVSKVGAQGLMQLMPGTADELNVNDPFNPEQNIRGGTQYMRFLLEMFNDMDTALAAYNVGPGTVERAKGIPSAGHRYIEKVRTRMAALKKRFGTTLQAAG